MKTLTVKQPWASLIVHGIKDIENRTWKTKYRGRVLIHAAAKEAGSFYELMTHDQLHALNTHFVFYPKRINSAIIGSVEIVDCKLFHPSIWAEKSDIIVDDNGDEKAKLIYNWVLANPILFDKPIEDVKGKLGLWYSWHDEIICPNCGQIQCAEVGDTAPFLTFIHTCHKCGYTIMESEWEIYKTFEDEQE